MFGSAATSTFATGEGASYYYDGFNAALALSANHIIGAYRMKKNVSGQVIGCSMVSAADGSAFTGTVTVYVTGDGGTQAIGSVASGICTHEGNGFHSYAPAQVETNYDHVAFTFIGTGAVPSSVQVYPNFPQTGDTFDRIGAAGAGLTDLATAANLATVAGYLDTEIAAILQDTGTDIPATLAAIASYLDTEIAAILADTSELQADWANGGRLDLILDARASQASVDDLPTNAELAIALGSADDATLAAIAALSIPTALENADAFLNRDMSAVSDTNDRSPLNALRLLRNKWSVSGSTMTVTKEDDSTAAWTAALSTDAAANPVIGSDPA